MSTAEGIRPSDGLPLYLSVLHPWGGVQLLRGGKHLATLRHRTAISKCVYIHERDPQSLKVAGFCSAEDTQGDRRQEFEDETSHTVSPSLYAYKSPPER